MISPESEPPGQVVTDNLCGEEGRFWLGAAVLVLITGAAWILGDITGISVLVVALVLAAVWTNVSRLGTLSRPTLAWAAKLPLRVGIVLLGLRLSYGAVSEVGGSGLVIVIATVLTALVGGMMIGARFGMSRPLTILVSAGFAICGQSAIAAAAPLSGADEDEIGYAVGLVALFGGMAVFLLPLLNEILGFPAATFGVLTGASVHDTSQVIATASVAGEVSLEAATIVKLTKVLFLGPVLLGVAYVDRRSNDGPKTFRQFIPWYVIGFVMAVIVRSLNVVPPAWLGYAKIAEGLAFAVAMVGVGASIRFATLRTLGRRPVLAGATLWAVILLVSVLSIRATGV